MFTLVHLSDVHLGPLAWPGLGALLGKRAFGYLNWLRGRNAMHRRPTVKALTGDLASQPHDHVAVTGDLVNIGLPSEFEAALEWLEVLGEPDRISVVPGNHDAYVRIAHEKGIGRWTEYMSANAAAAEFDASRKEPFPYVRVYGGVALIGLSTAIPTRPFTAYGRLGEYQLKALPPLLDRLRDAGLFRVVMLHHPPLPGLASMRRGLRDVAALSSILREHGAELALYGHDHEQKVNYLDTATGRLAAVCVPSATASVAGHKPLARYNIFEIGGNPAAWTCMMTGRGLTEPGGAVTEIEKVDLALRPTA